MIPVTKTFIPPLTDYLTKVERAFNNGWLTNRGELIKELEEKIKTKLGVSDVLMMCNGTIPIQIALKIFAQEGEVVTTPFSYVATTSSILWEHCTPVFVDIHPNFLTIDETKIEAAITDKTTCILATHVFGNPCHVEEIEKIANKHGLNVIYDAAHCFGVNYLGQSIFNFGDAATCSMHATKIFHTGEGGAFFAKNPEIMKQAFLAHNFGHEGYENFQGVGVNGKISELQAAMGLAVLPYFDEIREERKCIFNTYFEKLNSLYQLLELRQGVEWNYSYFPLIFQSEEALHEVLAILNQNQIFPRRYFYPSLNKLNYLVDSVSLEISESIAKRVICLPLYVGLKKTELDLIIQILTDYANSRS